MRTTPSVILVVLVAVFGVFLWAAGREDESDTQKHVQVTGGEASIPAPPQSLPVVPPDDGISVGDDVHLTRAEDAAPDRDSQSAPAPEEISNSSAYSDRETYQVLTILLSTRMTHTQRVSYLKGLADSEEEKGGLDLAEMSMLMSMLNKLDEKGVFESSANDDLQNIRCTESLCEFTVELDGFDRTLFGIAWRSDEGIGAMEFPQYWATRDTDDPELLRMYLIRPAIDQYRDEIIQNASRPLPGQEN